MNLTVLSVLIAFAQPLIQMVFNNYSAKKLKENTKLALFTCLHSIKGRRRYKSILLKDKVFADALQGKLTELGIFDRITVNNVTGSILLTYKCEEKDVDTVIDHLNAQTQKVTDCMTNTGHSAMNGSKAYRACGHAANVGQNSLIGQSLRKYTNKVNSCVKLSTNGIADLAIVVGSVCLLWGGYKIITQNQVPNGPSLVWWGYKILEGGTK
ncbi:MAG: HMA2 domain-containing protein [Succinivibrio sp.]